MKNFFIGFSLFAALLLPAFAFAQFENQIPSGGGFQNTIPGGSSNFSTAPSGSFTAFSLTNPLKVNSICGLIKALLQALLVIGLPIAVLFLIFAGLKYVTALGKPTAIAEANKNLLYTVIGIAIFLGAALIAQVIATTVSQISAQSGAGFQNVGSCN